MVSRVQLKDVKLSILEVIVDEGITIRTVTANAIRDVAKGNSGEGYIPAVPKLDTFSAVVIQIPF